MSKPWSGGRSLFSHFSVCDGNHASSRWSRWWVPWLNWKILAAQPLGLCISWVKVQQQVWVRPKGSLFGERSTLTVPRRGVLIWLLDTYKSFCPQPYWEQRQIEKVRRRDTRTSRRSHHRAVLMLEFKALMFYSLKGMLGLFSIFIGDEHKVNMRKSWTSSFQ